MFKTDDDGKIPIEIRNFLTYKPEHPGVVRPCRVHRRGGRCWNTPTAWCHQNLWIVQHNQVGIRDLLRLSKIWFISIEFSVSMGSFYHWSVRTANDPHLPIKKSSHTNFLFVLGSTKPPLQSCMGKCKKFLRTRKLHSIPEVLTAWQSFLPTGKDVS